MAATTENLVLNIGDMIDMAIGTPEVPDHSDNLLVHNRLLTKAPATIKLQNDVGVVDFNMLQTVLHCLAQQQHILTKPVEVRGVSVPLNIGRDNENVTTINVKEFDVGTDGKPPIQKLRSHVPNDTILVVERMKKTDALSQDGSGKATVQASAPKPSLAAVTATAAQAGPAGQDGLTLVTYSKFNLLESNVQELQKRVYGSIPKNEEILEEVRSQTNIKAIQDMWTNLNVSARLEAAEIGIAKLSSLVQDIINETAGLQDLAAKAAEQTGAASAGVSAVSTPALQSARGAPSTIAAATSAPSAAGIVSGDTASKAEMEGITDFVNQIRIDLDNLSDLFYTAMQQMPVDIDLPPPSEPGPALEEILPPRPGGVVSTGGGGGGIGGGGATSRMSRLTTHKSRAGGATIDGDVLQVMERLTDVEKRIDTCCKTLGKGEGVVSDQLSSFQDQLEHLAKQVAGLTNLTSGTITPDLIKDLQGLMHLFQTVQEMQEQLKQVHDTALQLVAEKEDRKHHINVLLEQIELLKTIKLDREDMTEAMAEKADLRMLARKVSHDQFELACDDLSKGLEHALGKLNAQESLWQQALDDIQREIETKLDKLELSPVKEFFNNKLKQLQESLKQMASLRREAEAAGTKRKLLRDVNCLSCDANAVMAAEAPPSLPVPKPFPAALSMKPYLSYELDTIRKTQASNLPQRNMHDWENIDKQMTQPPKQQFKVRSGADKHLCNRYCGGSHTMTTPAQRVARLGHFIKQWGPDVLPLSSGFAAGDDGRMYRIQAEGAGVGPGGAVDTCTPKVSKKPELPQVSSERLGEDCKCLDPPTPGPCKK